MPKRDMTARDVLAILDRPASERHYVQFTLREEVKVRSLTEALEAATSVDQKLILVNVLGMYPPAKSAARVFIGLLSDKNVEVRHDVADALGKLRNKQGGMAMLERLPIEKSSRVRGMLLAGVGAAGIGAGLPALLRALDSASPLERQGAAWALGELARPEALPALQSRADNESDDWVRATIQEALKKLAQRGSR